MYEIKTIIGDAITKLIENLYADGKTETEIEQILKSDVFIQNSVNALFKMTTITVNQLQNNMPDEMKYINTINNDFYNRNVGKWGEAFDYFETLYFILIESAEMYQEHITNEIIRDRKYLYEVLRALHAKGLQIYDEILCLMKNGFADGAYARWRSIYELEVVARFIAMHGEKVAESYFNYVIDDNHYAWASDCFKSLSEKGVRINFVNLEEKCKFYKNNWEKNYGLASKIIHPSSSGVFGRLSNQKDSYKDLLVVGRSDYGIHIPAIDSIQQIILLSSHYFTLFSELNIDASFYLSLVTKWGDIAIKKICDKHKDIFKEEIILG